MDGSRKERAHLVRKAEGYWWLSAARGEMVCERVRWDTGSCTGDGCSRGIGNGSTLGGGTTNHGGGCSLGIWDGPTLGGGTTLGVGTTLGGGTTHGGGTAFGGGVAVGLADGGTSAVLVF